MWLFFGVVLRASAVGLVRLHATGGYCTVRHGMIPGMLLLLAAAHGLTWLMPGRRSRGTGSGWARSGFRRARRSGHSSWPGLSSALT